MIPEDTWLREDSDSRIAYFPDEAGHFNLLSELGTPAGSFSTLIVEDSTVSCSAPGPQSGPGRQSVSSLPFLAPCSASSSSEPPLFPSVVEKPRAKRLANLIKILKARNLTVETKRSGKPGFVCTVTGQTYLELSNDTANVSYVSEAIRKLWGSDHTIVSSEGLEIEDCVATQCESFY